MGSLTTLETLNLYYNDIVDVTPLATMAGLTELYLYGNQIVDVSPLADLTGLLTLDLGFQYDYTNVVYVLTTGVDTLVTLVNATYLNLSSNGVTIPCADLATLIAALTASVVDPSTPFTGTNCT